MTSLDIDSHLCSTRQSVESFRNLLDLPSNAIFAYKRQTKSFQVQSTKLIFLHLNLDLAEAPPVQQRVNPVHD